MKVRSSRTPEPGAFLVMDVAKQQAREAGRSIVDLSVGSSDLQPPPEALDALKVAADDPQAHKYCLKSGTMPLLRAATDWFNSIYGVQLDPETQALSLIGSQEGLAHLLLAVTDPGDGILMCDVAYPSYFGAVKVAGLQPTFIPLDPQTLQPDFNKLTPSSLTRCRCLLLNYPNNPTGVVVDNQFWQQVLLFCQQHDLLLIHDNPYVGQVYDAAAASSPLSLPGAEDCCVELFSFAKSYQLGGFRLGFILGNADVINSLESVKAPIDFNQYMGIQRMGVVCLQLPVQRVRDYAAVWQRRATALVAVLQQYGWQIAKPKACMYVWAKLPDGLGVDDLEFSQQLISETGIAVSPGRGFGPGGRGYIRFALVRPEEVLTAAGQAVGEFANKLRQQSLQT